MSIRSPILCAVGVLTAFLGLVAVVGATRTGPEADASVSPTGARASTHQRPPRASAKHDPAKPHVDRADPKAVPRLPGGRTRVFDHRFLVAYYGTPQTTSLGVLGTGTPSQVTDRLRSAARPFHRPGQRPQLVYELIASVVDGGPGGGGDYSHEIPDRYVREYIRAAHRNNALLLIDVQPGRSDFLTISKRWAWALKDPWVGLALDPEWRMGPHQVPGRVVGHVTAQEVNRTTAWLDRFTARHRLPQKLLVLHQFRTQMVRRPAEIRHRPHLSIVEHVDGFGRPGAKLATFHRVARPRGFRLGFKLFYRQDKPRMSAAQVLRIRPRVDFVSFQ